MGKSTPCTRSSRARSTSCPGQTSVRAYSFTRPYFTHLLFNVKHPILKDARVRQALSYAVDRQAIIDGALDGQGVVADGPIWPHHWAYAAQKTYTHNIEAATLRLDAAGLRLGKVREAGHMPSRFRFKCLTVERNATFEKIAVLLQKQLYDIGVDMEIETVSLDELGARFTAGNYDAILAERTTARSLYWTYIAFHSTKLGGPYKSADATLDHLRGATDDCDGTCRRERPAADFSRRSAGHLYRLAESRPSGQHKVRRAD